MSLHAVASRVKQNAAERAVEHVRSGMVLGLGTGYTARFAVEAIGRLLKAGELQDIVGVPTSVETRELASSLGIPLTTLGEQPALDIATRPLGGWRRTIRIRSEGDFTSGMIPS